MSEGSAKSPEKGTEKPRKFQAIKGVRDILPPETALWNRVEQTAHSVFATFGYGEIRLPIFESTELFARSLGTDTDIVSKEMYTFALGQNTRLSLELSWAYAVDAVDEFHSKDGEDAEALESLWKVYDSTNFLLILLKDLLVEQIPGQEDIRAFFERVSQQAQNLGALLKQSPVQFHKAREITATLRSEALMLPAVPTVSLRPEATASVCRAYIEHGMHTLPQPVKLYYLGPMFRRERPQKGRYRQFYQIGAEVLGGADAPAIDAEVIQMVMTYFAKLGLEGATLYINSIGCKECRPEYADIVRALLETMQDRLGPDSQRRIKTNPLRVLDSKLGSEQAVIESLPRITDHLCPECAQNYADVKRELDLRGIQYQENWRLVRGLDYYVRTTFEITAAGLGSQDAVCGGGRYDGLVELLGGPPAKGIGFAIGEDRLVLSLQESGKAKTERILDVFVAWMGEKAYPMAVRATRRLREAGFSVELPATEQKFGKALGQADKLGARFAVILGDDEAAGGQWSVKRLSDGAQKKLAESEALAFLKEG